MGIYLGQLPPAEVARFKAELAETIVANFCYPRFFDYRSESLQMRPIDRTKRQEVWLYLSSVDFTAWSRVDLMSTDFPHHIERLFIQFVQRNRSFFGSQGRRRMLDIRLSITSCASSVSQRLRHHLTGKQVTPLFGSPRPALSWTAIPISGHAEPAWEQIMTSTMALQQQLQEWRGEIRPSAVGEEQVASANKTSQNGRSDLTEAPQPISTPSGQGRRASRSQEMPANPVNPAASLDYPFAVTQQPTAPTPPLVQPDQQGKGIVTPIPNQAVASAVPMAPVAPNVSRTPPRTSSGSIPASPVVPPRRSSGHLTRPAEQNPSARQSGVGVRSRIATSPSPVASPMRQPAQSAPSAEPLPTSAPQNAVVAPARPVEAQYVRPSALPDTLATAPTGPHPVRTVPPSPLGFSPGSAPANASSQRDVFVIGEDDVAIFEQMRSQLMLWLRIEALRAGLEVTGQGPGQLLEMLRQQARYDETRLQIVSTLLNLASQVIKTGTVSVLDYKQALTFHLMHTKRL